MMSQFSRSADGLPEVGLTINSRDLRSEGAQDHRTLAEIRRFGFRFVRVRGDYASPSAYQWLREWQASAACEGLSLVPTMTAIPQTLFQDAEICSRLADLCGAVVVDMKEGWASYNLQMLLFGQRYRASSGGTPVVVAGHGTPFTLVGTCTGWPYSEMMSWADAYSPEWYLGNIPAYHSGGVRAGMDWARGICVQAFGLTFPLCPSLSVASEPDEQGPLPLADISSCQEYADELRWPVSWHVGRFLNQKVAAACLGSKAGQAARRM